MDVQFDLPIGALVNGWRHLGGGRFAADTRRPIGLGMPPALIEGVVVGEGAALDPLVIEPFDDPIAAAPTYRVVAFAAK